MLERKEKGLGMVSITTSMIDFSRSYVCHFSILITTIIVVVISLRILTHDHRRQLDVISGGS